MDALLIPAIGIGFWLFMLGVAFGVQPMGRLWRRWRGW